MSIRPIILFAGLLAAAPAIAEDAWRWTDEDGIVHYSDVPVDGAERVDLSVYTKDTGAQLSRRPAIERNAADEAVAAADEPFQYETLAITSPAAEETLWNIAGVLDVTLALAPPLQEGHQVRVYFDGNPREVSGTSFQIDEVWRGVHNIQAEVIDSTGKLMIRSQPNRFYVQQNTVMLP